MAVLTGTPALPKGKELKGGSRNVKLETLQSGYTPAKRRLEIATIAVFSLLWLAAFWNTFTATGVENQLPITLFAFVVSLFVGDFLAGFVHWFCDTWGSPEAPVIGVIIRSFREHHIDPKAMTLHDFIEVSGDSCIIPIPFLAAAALWRNAGVYQAELFILHCTLWVTAVVMMTNQVHKWAHLGERARPRAVTFLQKCNLLLTPSMHSQHHRPPFDKDYCIFNGWMNPILRPIDFWKRTERAITALTGAVPRADDADWTERFEVEAAKKK